jgi:hypothetical protein
MKAFPCEWAEYDREAEENLVIDCGKNQKILKSKGKWVKHNDPGMDLRDYFAAKAMSAFLVGCDDVKDNYNEKGIAIMSYAMADAMMKERKK